MNKEGWRKNNWKHLLTKIIGGNKTGGKMTLFVDAARAAFNSSTTTVSVKRDIARF